MKPMAISISVAAISIRGSDRCNLPRLQDSPRARFASYCERKIKRKNRPEISAARAATPRYSRGSTVPRQQESGTIYIDARFRQEKGRPRCGFSCPLSQVADIIRHRDKKHDVWPPYRHSRKRKKRSRHTRGAGPSGTSNNQCGGSR